MPPRTQLELETLWIKPEGIEGVNYRYGDLVSVKAGKHTGLKGVVIALFSLEVEPFYLLELPDGKSIGVHQAELGETERNTGRTLIIRTVDNYRDV